MVKSVFATKIGMTQAWDVSGKRWAVTRCKVQPNQVLQVRLDSEDQPTQYFIGYGQKKLKNMSKPLRSIVEKGGFSEGVRQIKGIKANPDSETKYVVGDTVKFTDFLQVGDIVKVQGTSKGRGFAGAVKRHGFAGGPKTHGQSDRHRAVGSIGAGTTPGKVLKGKKMPGHYGVDTNTVRGLVVLHIDEANNEIWLSGPVPGHLDSIVMIETLGQNKQIEIDKAASHIAETTAPAEEVTEEEVTESTEQETTDTETVTA